MPFLSYALTCAFLIVVLIVFVVAFVKLTSEGFTFYTPMQTQAILESQRAPLIIADGKFISENIPYKGQSLEDYYSDAPDIGLSRQVPLEKSRPAYRNVENLYAQSISGQFDMIY